MREGARDLESRATLQYNDGIETGDLPLEISVVVPVFNSEGSLAGLTERVHATLGNRTFELLFVSDGSTDGSWAMIRTLAAAHPAVSGIKLMRNYGQHNALLAGVRAARGRITVTMDDDLQHPPEEIPKLLAKIEAGADVVYGTPARPAHSTLRNASSWITKFALQKAIGAETARKVSAFRAFRTPLRRAFAEYQSPFVSMDVLLTWATQKFTAVAVEHRPREIGRSHYTLRALIVHALTVATGFSTLPLRLASLLGFALTLGGVAVLAYVLIRYMALGGSVPGFPFLASIIAVFSGAQLFSLGIIGEYLARIHVRTMEKPTYAVEEAVGAPRPA